VDPDRIPEHPVLGPAPESGVVSFTYAGQTLTGRQGDTIAAALWAAGIRSVGSGPGDRHGALYCGIGHCFVCRITVDGVQGVRGCLVPIRAGMRLEPDPEEDAAGHAD
jgi:sarcosine oxidase subunit alpha